MVKLVWLIRSMLFSSMYMQKDNYGIEGGEKEVVPWTGPTDFPSQSTTNAPASQQDKQTV